MTLGYPIVEPGLGVDAQIIDPSWRSYTPLVMLVGAGNAPTYVTNSGRFLIVNNIVYCDVLLDGNGGTNGSGAGILNISLPVTPSPSRLAGFLDLGGYLVNNTAYQSLMATLTTGSPWASLSGWNAANALTSLTGADQNNSTRTIRAHFWYECDLLP